MSSPWLQGESADLQESVVATSAEMRAAVTRCVRFATTGMSVLLVGETGTGKEVLARLVHRCSTRTGALIDVNCAALPGELFEAELFGHQRGAFTGATDRSDGLVVAADRGTLFLDEISSLPAVMQAKLLRLLETREVRAVGGVRKQLVDFRIVAAAQEDLHERVEDGRFRRDLFHRIAAVVVRIPPLRERVADVEPLAQHFASRHGAMVESAAIGVLRRQQWLGNARELKAVIDRAVMLSDTARLAIRAVVEAIEAGGMHPLRGAAGGRGEEAELLDACRRFGGNVDQVAAALAISRATVYRRLSALGVKSRSFLRGEAREVDAQSLSERDFS